MQQELLSELLLWKVNQQLLTSQNREFDSAVLDKDIAVFFSYLNFRVLPVGQ